MNKRLNNRQHMIDAVLALLISYEEIFKNVAQFTEIFARFRELVNALNILRAQVGTLRVPFAERRAQAQDNYVLCLSRLCHYIIEVAKESNDDDTLATAQEKLKMVGRGNSRQAIDAGEIILGLAANTQEAIKGMSRGEETLTEAKAAFELFKDYSLKGSRRRTEGSHVLERYKNAQDETVAFIRGTLFAFFLNWSSTYPDFFDLFKRSMRIPDFGAPKSGEEENAEENGNNAAAADGSPADQTAVAEDAGDMPEEGADAEDASAIGDETSESTPPEELPV